MRSASDSTVDGRQTSHTAGWKIVFRNEMSDLWLGGKAIVFLILFSVLLGMMTFLLATNKELSLTPPLESMFLILKTALAVGLFFGLVLGADTVSGERERATIESLLLTPVGRRDVIVGKYLTAISPWPAAMAVAAGYLALIAPDMSTFASSFISVTILGTVLVAGFTGFGVLVSVWSATNKGSLSTSLLIYILFLVPTQFPGPAQTGAVGKFIKRINPMESVNQFLEKTIVNNRTFEEMSSWLASPVVFAVVVVGALIFLAPSALRLDPPKLGWGRKAGALTVSVALVGLVMAGGSRPAMAAQESQGVLSIDVDVVSREVKTGDTVEFTTTITAPAGQAGPWIVAMNIVNLGDGDPVDPEDWSPTRTQQIEELGSDRTAQLDWEVNAILKGDYLVYMVVLSAPETSTDTSEPVASSGIHLTVEQFVRINPGGVLPLAIGMPAFLGGLLFAVMRSRRRLIDSPVEL